MYVSRGIMMLTVYSFGPNDAKRQIDQTYFVAGGKNMLIKKERVAIVA